MRRTLIVALSALALGTLAFLVRNGEKPPPSAPPPRAGHVCEDHPSDSHEPHGPAAATAPGVGHDLRIQVNSQGRPLPSALVNLTSGSTHHVMTFDLQTKGSRVIQRMPDGHYDILVRHPGCVTERTSIRRKDGKPDSVTLDLKAGNVFSGSVRNVNSKPLHNAKIVFVSPEGGQVDPEFRTTTDEDGEFNLDILTMGAFNVRVHAEGYQSADLKGLTFGTWGERRRHDFVLLVGMTLSGRVLDEQHKPIPESIVMARNDQSSNARVGETGEFRLHGLGPGPVSCVATAPGYSTVRLRNITPGTEGLLFILPRACVIAGRLEGAPKSLSWVLDLELRDPNTGKFVKRQEKPFGGAEDSDRFSVTDLPPGTYRAVVQAPGYEPVDLPVFTLAQGEQNLELLLKVRPKAR